MPTIKVYVDEKNAEGKNTGKRIPVEAEFIKDNQTTIVVKLPDGHIITRKKKRDVVV